VVLVISVDNERITNVVWMLAGNKDRNPDPVGVDGDNRCIR
jgi:hypothetical protein